MLPLDIQSIHFNAAEPLKDLIHKRVNKLATFYKQILRGEVYLRLESDETKQNKVIEIKLYAPGTAFFATARAQSFETAMAKAVEALRRQIRRAKGKQSPSSENHPKNMSE